MTRRDASARRACAYGFCARSGSSQRSRSGGLRLQRSPRRSHWCLRSACWRSRAPPAGLALRRPRASARGRRARGDPDAARRRRGGAARGGLDAPAGLSVADGAHPVALRLLPDEEREMRLRLRCARWAIVRARRLCLSGAGPRSGSFACEDRIDAAAPLRVYPRPERCGGWSPPLATQAAIGSEVRRAKGDGLEFADTRPFVTGDRVRSVNWRASARRGRARRQRAPSGAEHGRRRLPRHLRRGA